MGMQTLCLWQGAFANGGMALYHLGSAAAFC